MLEVRNAVKKRKEGRGGGGGWTVGRDPETIKEAEGIE